MRLCLGVLLACLALPVFADDDLPNFNAPVDNSPLNADKVNHAFGVTLFKAPSLWKEDDGVVAGRLGWPEESRTHGESSFRLYPTEAAPVTILGARAYSCVLYATKGSPTEISLVFVNVGDYDWDKKFAAEAGDKLKDTDEATASDDVAEIKQQIHDDFEKALKQDAQSITDGLTHLFGDPSHQGFGGGAETREQVKRWDWQGHAFLLSNVPDTYVALRIVPTDVADSYGTGGGLDRDALKATLLQRVVRSDNGDVVVGDIPMVDQGPKGYCVPATWERYLRFLGIPADMYVLAMAGGTSEKGTNVSAMMENVESLVGEYHRKIDVNSGDLDLTAIAKNIDAGLPLMWSCEIHRSFERAISQRKEDRAEVTDWDAWAAQLAAGDDKEIASEITDDQALGAHQRMIIGYNAKTGEIAISDSWSKAFAIRWMTLREANAINLGHTYAIEP